MPSWSPSTRKHILTAAIFAAVLALVVVIVVTRPRVLPPAKEGIGEVEIVLPRPTFSITNIDGIEDVLNAISSVSPQVPPPTQGGVRGGGEIRAAVLPHHTKVGSKLVELWSDIAARSAPSVIVIISPNHDNDGEGTLQTTRGVWPTPFGPVETDDGLVNRLVSLDVAADQPDAFVNEHGIGTHVPYLAELFPGTPIVPVMAKSTADLDDARSLELVLEQILPDDALVIASIDFSHYLPQDVTDAMDAETLAWIAGRRYTELERQQSDHFDTPFGLIAYLLWNDRNGFASDLVWQETSHRLLGEPNAPGTSYLVFFSSDSTTPSFHDSTTLTVAGDMMLGRAVATSLARTTVPAAFSDAAAVFSGSDLAFANLESVLTSSAQDTGKAIFFKGDPARVDVLNLLGLTHVSVSNNHVDDYGVAGWTESVQHLKDAGVVPVGDYDDRQEPVFAEADGKTFAFLAYADVYRRTDKTLLAEDIAKARASAETVVVSFHWGVEYAHIPTQSQEDLAHAAIDAGASLVIGHHPHVLQGIETYNGGLILYSLGNFVFDQIGTDENESMVAKIVWNPSTGSGQATRTLELVPMRVRGTFPRAATNEERLATLGRVVGWSDMEFPEGFATVGKMDW